MAVRKQPAKRVPARRTATPRRRTSSSVPFEDDDFWRRPERFGELTPAEEAKLRKDIARLRETAQRQADSRERELIRQQKARERASNDLTKMREKAKAQTKANRFNARVARGLSAREVGKVTGRLNRSTGTASGRSNIGTGANTSGGRGGSTLRITGR